MEFAQGVLEARCEYCQEVLIRELPPPPPVVHAPLPPPHAPVVGRKATVWPFLIGGLATMSIAGASGIASLAASMKPLPEPTPEVKVTMATTSEVRREETPATPRSEARESTPRAKATSPSSPLGRRPTRASSAAPATATAPAEPPKPPPFNTDAAVAGLDAAKAKAEASCRGSAGVRLFVQMGFDADGANRGAALSDPKLKDTPEAKCALRVFRAVRIPAFDMATRPSGLGRPVRL